MISETKQFKEAFKGRELKNSCTYRNGAIIYVIDDFKPYFDYLYKAVRKKYPIVTEQNMDDLLKTLFKIKENILKKLEEEFNISPTSIGWIISETELEKEYDKAYQARELKLKLMKFTGKTPIKFSKPIEERISMRSDMQIRFGLNNGKMVSEADDGWLKWAIKEKKQGFVANGGLRNSIILELYVRGYDELLEDLIK